MYLSCAALRQHVLSPRRLCAVFFLGYLVYLNKLFKFGVQDRKLRTHTYEQLLDTCRQFDSDSKCCWPSSTKLTKNLSELFDPTEPVLLASLSTLHDLLFLGAGLGTTGTRSLHKFFCKQGYRSTHWLGTCNFPEEHRLKAVEFTQFLDRVLRRPDIGTLHDDVLLLIKMASEVKLQAISDSGFANILKPVLAASPNAKVVLTYRSPHHWAKSRKSKHASSELMCTPPWHWPEDAYQPLECARHQHRRSQNPELFTRFTVDGDVKVEKRPTSGSIGTGLTMFEAIELGYIFHNLYVESIVPEDRLVRSCVFDGSSNFSVSILP